MRPASAPSHAGAGWLIGLPLAGCAIAAYLALYQLDIVATVWEPLFGDGSRIILHSTLARALPIPDAALGALGYLAEAVCASVRWKAPGWVGFAYGAIVIVFAVASVALVALQWGYFHAWCTLCLTSAVLSFVIAGVVVGQTREKRDEQ
ncbi:MAG TPA: vitamin K epoxide reductase family protein [Gemmatimonadaceae bacterium]